jgi:hypothetical protein
MIRIVTAIFILILILPMGLQVAKVDVDMQIERPQMTTPRFSLKGLMRHDYYQYIGRYFTSRLPLRDPLVWSKKWLDLNLFKTTEAKAVHVGTRGWLYPRRAVETHLTDAQPKMAAARQLVLKLHAVEKMFAATGGKFVFAIAPSKANIYPEFLGARTSVDSRRTNFYTLFLQQEAAYPLESFVRLDEVLRQSKSDGTLLFEPEAREWNHTGARIAAQTLLQHTLSRDSAPVAAPPIVMGYPDTGLRPLVEGRTPVQNGAPVRFQLDFDRPDQPRGIIYGDRFLTPLVPYVAPYFNQLDMIWTDTVPSPHGESWNSADIVVLERAEDQLASLDLALDAILAMLQPELRSPVTEALDVAQFKAVEQIVLRPGTQGLAIKSVGADSIFEIPFVPGSSAASVGMLRLIVQSAHADVLQVHYPQTADGGGIRQLKPGVNTVYLPLPFGPRLSPRINPGVNVGIFTLTSAEVLRFSGLRQPTTAVPPMVAAASEAQPETPSDQNSTQSGDAAQTISAADQVREVSGEARRLQVNDFSDGRIFQRRGAAADILVSGTYTGPPGAVEARAVHYGTSTAVVPWVLIDAQPQNGIFLGELSQVPQGGWYKIEVRLVSNPSVASRGKHRWGVGMLVACLGQSNMKEWFYTGEQLAAHPLLRWYTAKGWLSPGMQGHGAIAFGNRLIARLGIPIGLLDYAVNGSGLHRKADWGTGYWEDTRPDSIYQQFVRGVSAAGGAIEFVIWMQGEADAARGTITEEEYRSSLERFIQQQLRSDIGNGSPRSHLPVLVVLMVKRPGGKDAPHQAVRNAQKRVAETVDDCFVGATTLDLTNMGKQHLAPDAYTTLGLRVSQTVLYVLGLETYYRGPQITAIRQIDSQTIEVGIQHHGGTDFTPPANLTGWEVLTGDRRLPLARVTRHDPQTIRIQLQTAADAPVSIRYLYGAMPDTTHPVRDNSTIGLPLEEYQPAH